MSNVTEDEIGAALRHAVPEPVEPGDRVAQVRSRARRLRRRRRTGGAALVALLAVAIGTPVLLSSAPDRSPKIASNPTSKPSRDPVAALRRPLALPVVAPGATCPVSSSRTFKAGGGFSGAFRGVGSGPMYFAGESTLPLTLPPPADSSYVGSAWGGQKVIWVVQGYTGPLLLRGGQVDGGHGLRFDNYIGAMGYTGGAGDGKPYSELVYLQGGTPESSTSVLTYPSAVRLQAPGCYAVQVDGKNFTELIVFRAVLTRG